MAAHNGKGTSRKSGGPFKLKGFNQASTPRPAPKKRGKPWGKAKPKGYKR